MLISYSEYNYSPSETTLWTVIAWRDGKIWPTVASAARGTWRWKRKTAPITFAVSLKVKITVLLDIPVFPLSSHVMMGNRHNLLDQSDLHFCICIICISRACSASLIRFSRERPWNSGKAVVSTSSSNFALFFYLATIKFGFSLTPLNFEASPWLSGLKYLRQRYLRGPIRPVLHLPLRYRLPPCWLEFLSIIHQRI